MTGQKRYQIRPVATGEFGVWDLHIGVWQTIAPTHADAQTWILRREKADAEPRAPSRLSVRMPLKD